MQNIPDYLDLIYLGKAEDINKIHDDLEADYFNEEDDFKKFESRLKYILYLLLNYNIQGITEKLGADIVLKFEDIYLKLISLEEEKKIVDVSPQIVSHLYIEFGKLFVDINHYSRHERLTNAVKKLADGYPEVKEYAIAYVVNALKVYEGVLNLTTTSEAHLTKILNFAEERGLDINDP